MGKRILPGNRSGKLTIVRRDGFWGDSNIARYIVRCDCGTEFAIRSMAFRQTGSCWTCSRAEGGKTRQRHGDAGTPLYAVYRGIKSRCRNPRYHRYPLYGAKGIDLCHEWEDYLVFREWALSHGWQQGLQIDRIDPAKGYDPENCQIVTRSENARRMRADYIFVKRSEYEHLLAFYNEHQYC